MTDLESLLVLNAVPGLGNARIKALIEYYGSPQNILALKFPQLKSDRALPDDVALNLVQFPRDEFLKNESMLMHRHGVRASVYADESYPERLRHIADAPVVLYVQGKIPQEFPMVAVVGSRRASIYGREVAEKFSMRLSECGIAVVSGLARGIDTSAHQGALKARGMTVAVLGCGLGQCYPPENLNLMERIAKTGAVISEFSMGVPPLAFNFPRRNRVISGLSLGVIVVEAAQRSGALITADVAIDQGRDVFAVPGPIGSPASQGTHDLIKNGAKLVTCIEDVLEDLKIPLGEFIAKPVDEPSSLIYKEGACPDPVADETLTDDERTLLRAVGLEARHVDWISESAGFAPGQVNMLLLQMEMRGLVEQLPGKFYKSVQSAKFKVQGF